MAVIFQFCAPIGSQFIVTRSLTSKIRKMFWNVSEEKKSAAMTSYMAAKEL